MKKMKSFAAAALAATMALSLCGCGGKLENKVHSLDDLPGKTIGVQLGTTGDLYATEYFD